MAPGCLYIVGVILFCLVVEARKASVASAAFVSEALLVNVMFSSRPSFSLEIVTTVESWVVDKQVIVWSLVLF